MAALLLFGGLAACTGPGKADGAVNTAAPTTVNVTATNAPSTATATTVASPVAPLPTATLSPSSVTADVSSTDQPTDTSALTPTISSIDQASFTQQVDDLVNNAGGTVEIVVALADGTIIYDHDGSESMEAASLYKLGIMVELYRQRDAGLITFDDPVYMYPGFFAEGEDVYTEDEIGTNVSIGDLLTNMITLSSNVAATALLYIAGTDNINNTLASLGLDSTEIRWTPGTDLAPDSATDDTSGSDSSTDDSSTDAPAPSDNSQDPSDTAPSDSSDPGDDTPTPTGLRAGAVLAAAHAGPRSGRLPSFDARADAALNVTTAEDVASLYMQLLRGEVVDAQASQEMLDLLAQQQINDRLPALLPDGTVVAHKTGNLDGLVHDAGVIYAPAGPIIVAALTEDVDEGVADDMISQIALLAYELAS